MHIKLDNTARGQIMCAVSANERSITFMDDGRATQTGYVAAKELCRSILREDDTDSFMTPGGRLMTVSQKMRVGFIGTCRDATVQELITSIKDRWLTLARSLEAGNVKPS